MLNLHKLNKQGEFTTRYDIEEKNLKPMLQVKGFWSGEDKTFKWVEHDLGAFIKVKSHSGVLSVFHVA